MNKVLYIPIEKGSFSFEITNGHSIINDLSRENNTSIETRLNLIDQLIDLASHHAIVRSKKKDILGSIRILNVPKHSTYLLEHFVLYNFKEYPTEKIREGVIEVSRTWVKKQSNILFALMVRKVVEFGLKNKIRYLVLSASDELSPLYLKLGCKKINSFRTEDKSIWNLFEFDFHTIKNPNEFFKENKLVLDTSK